jgi:hypothetical protein
MMYLLLQLGAEVRTGRESMCVFRYGLHLPVLLHYYACFTTCSRFLHVNLTVITKTLDKNHLPSMEPECSTACSQ